MNIDVFVKTEHEFLNEMEAEYNNHGVYLFISVNKHERISLDYYLLEYKQWLIAKGHVKEIKK